MGTTDGGEVEATVGLEGVGMELGTLSSGGGGDSTINGGGVEATIGLEGVGTELATLSSGGGGGSGGCGGSTINGGGVEAPIGVGMTLAMLSSAGVGVEATTGLDGASMELATLF